MHHYTQLGKGLFGSYFGGFGVQEHTVAQQGSVMDKVTQMAVGNDTWQSTGLTEEERSKVDQGSTALLKETPR